MQQVGDGRRHRGVAREVAVRHPGVEAARTGQLRTHRRHRAIAVAGERVHELPAAPTHRGHGLLADAGHDREARVRRCQCRLRGARGRE